MAKKLLYEETVIKGKKPRWPYDNTLSTAQRYSTVIARIKSEKPNYTFSGWQVIGSSTVYPEPFNDENSNPFPTFTADGEINAVWSRVENVTVMCVPSSNTVGSDGDTITLTYYAMVGDNIVTDGVTLNVNSGETTVSYTMGQDSVTPNGIVRSITINPNSTEDSKQLVVYATYNGQNSETVYIYQAAQDEQIIPDCDYFLFNYFWTYGDNGTDDDESDDLGDGIDLDSLTVIYVEDEHGNIVDKSFTGKPVGFRYIMPTNRQENYEVRQNDNPDGILCMEHSGDNTNSGDEGAVLCLTNIVNTGEIRPHEKIIIKIYANWFERRIDGNMEINCRAFKRISGTPNFDEDITRDSQNHFKFIPTDKCEVVWDNFTQAFNVQAYGIMNALFEDAYTPYLHNIYSPICTVTYDVDSGAKVYTPRATDTGRDASGVNTNLGTMFKTSETNTNKTISATDRQCDFGGIYVDYYNTGELMEALITDEDKLYMSVWVGSPQTPNLIRIFDKNDLDKDLTGFENCEGFIESMRLTKTNENGINKLNIHVNVSENTERARRTIRFWLIKCPCDSEHKKPGIVLRETGPDESSTQSWRYFSITQNMRDE